MMSIKRIDISLLCVVALLFGAANAFGNAKLRYSDCLNQAETYYEQIYCEIKAQGEGGALPSLSDFKNNNEQMQALLLKRKAEALRIPFKMPENKNKTAQKKRKIDRSSDQVSAASCQYHQRRIICGDKTLSIVANQANSSLNRSALNDENKMGLTPYTGDLKNSARVLEYLTKSYTRYIEKMLEIGLGGSTMSFTKFYYLFERLSGQGIRVEKRFESMYAYLKQDKRTLGVREKIEPIEGLSMSDCNRLTPSLITCDNKVRNRVYVR